MIFFFSLTGFCCAYAATSNNCWSDLFVHIQVRSFLFYVVDLRSFKLYTFNNTLQRVEKFKLPEIKNVSSLNIFTTCSIINNFRTEYELLQFFTQHGQSRLLKTLILRSHQEISPLFSAIQFLWCFFGEIIVESTSSI